VRVDGETWVDRSQQRLALNRELLLRHPDDEFVARLLARPELTRRGGELHGRDQAMAAASEAMVEALQLARALTSGASDTRFAIGTGFGVGDVPVNAMVLVSAASVASVASVYLYVGGSFTTYNGAITNRLARLSDLGGSL
jgi:hypothetical protein